MTINDIDIQPAIDTFKSNPTPEGLKELWGSIQHLSKKDQDRILNNVQRDSYESMMKKQILEANEKGLIAEAKSIEKNLSKWIKKGRPLQYG